MLEGQECPSVKDIDAVDADFRRKERAEKKELAKERKNQNNFEARSLPELSSIFDGRSYDMNDLERLWFSNKLYISVLIFNAREHEQFFCAYLRWEHGTFQFTVRSLNAYL